MRTTMGKLAAAVAVLVGVHAFWPQGGIAPLAPCEVVAQEGGPPVPAKKSEPTDRALNGATFEKLKQRIDVDFHETPLADALAFLGQAGGVQFYLDWPALYALGLEADTPVSLRLKSISTEMALDLTLQQLDLSYTLRAGIVIVTSSDRLSENQIVQVYDVADLRSRNSPSDKKLGATPAAQTLEAMWQLADESLPHREFGGGETVRVPLLESMLQSISRRDTLLEERNEDAAKQVEQELYRIARQVLQRPAGEYDDLLDLVTETISPDSWSEVGGPGAIVAFQDKMVVTQTLKNHRLIEDLLEQLRATGKSAK